MQEQKISLETAKLAKSKGFDEYCQSWFELDGSIHYIDELEDCPTDQIKYGTLIKEYSDIIYLRPTQSLLQRWLREVHKIHIEIEFDDDCDWCCHIIDINSSKTECYMSGFESYETSEEAGLLAALKLIK